MGRHKAWLAVPDGSLDGGWGDLPELLEFGDFVEPYWDSDAEKDLNTLQSPQPPILSPPPPAPAPPPPVLLSSPLPRKGRHCDMLKT